MTNDKTKKAKTLLDLLSEEQFSVEVQDTVDNILSGLESENRPRRFKELMLALTQLYFDALIDNTPTEPDHEFALDGLFSALKLTIKSFYMNGDLPLDKIRQKINRHRTNYLLSGKRVSSYRHMYHRETLVEMAASDLRDDPNFTARKIDTIIPIAAGGFELAMLIAQQYPQAKLLPVRFSIARRNDKTVKKVYPDEEYQQNISNKSILIIEDFIQRGISSTAVINWASNFNPSRIALACVEGEYNEPTVGKLNRIKLGVYVD